VSQELPVLWSPAQQAWLQAMGYTVYHDGQLAAELDAALQLSVAEADAAAAPAVEQVRAPIAPAREPPVEAKPGSRQERPAPTRRETPGTGHRARRCPPAAGWQCAAAGGAAPGSPADRIAACLRL